MGRSRLRGQHRSLQLQQQWRRLRNPLFQPQSHLSGGAGSGKPISSEPTLRSAYRQPRRATPLSPSMMPKSMSLLSDYNQLHPLHPHHKLSPLSPIHPPLHLGKRPSETLSHLILHPETSQLCSPQCLQPDLPHSHDETLQPMH